MNRSALDRWRYELRRSGRVLLALPLVTALAVLGTGVWAGPVGRVVVAHAVPAVAGIVAATVVASERLVELHLTVPTSYRSTVARRLALLMLAAALGAGLLVPAGDGAGVGPDAGATVAVVASGAALVGLASWVTTGSGSAARGCTVVLAASLTELLVLERTPGPVRVPLLLVAVVVLAALTARRLSDGEAQLRGNAG